MASSTESTARVKLDLGEFFTDYRRYSYILLKNSWATVEDIKQYVETTFQLADIVLLTSDEVFLPLKEDLKVVRGDDELKVVTTSYVPSPKKAVTKTDNALNISPTAGNLTISKRKRTHKRKIPNAEKFIHEALTRVPPKVKKTDIATNVTQHFYFDDECNAKTDKVEFVDFIDSLDPTKPRIIKAKVIAKQLLTENDETPKTAVEETSPAEILVC